MVRRLLALLTALLALGAAAALPSPAGAQRPWDDPSGDVGYDDGSDDDSWSDETTVTTVPGTPPAVTLPPVAPPATTPTTPTTTPVPARPVPTTPTLPPVATTKQPMVAGRVAILRTDGTAAIPRGAPKTIRNIIRAANEIIGKPYVWGGGHRRLVDRGYDCSGSVSYALIRNGLLRSPLVSGQLAHAYRSGAGRWLTIYANKTHVYMEVAGIRFDTSPYGDWWSGRSGVRWRPLVGKRRGFHVRHIAGY